MHVSDLMTSKPVTCMSEESLDAATGLMWFHDVGALPVVDALGVLVGMITDRDVALAVHRKKVTLGQIPVSDVMSGNVYSCQAGDTIRHVEELMRRHRVRRVPVVDEHNCPVGMLSLADLARGASDNLHLVQARELARVLSALSTPKAPPQAHSR